MFYGNYTHTKEILERVREEFGFEDVHSDAAMEHIWIALGKLGVKNFLEDYDEEIIIEGNRGLMPNNVMLLEGMRDKNSKIMLTPSKDIFINSNNSVTTSEQTWVSGFTVTGIDNPEQGEYNQSGELIPNYAYVEHWPATNNLDPGSSIGYQIRGNYLFCELPSATIEIKYKGFPIWDDYTPKIPNDAKVINFVVQYIGEMVAKKYWIQDKLSRDKFETISRDRMFAQGEARNKMLLPNDSSDMEFIKRMMMRLTPQPEQFASGFKYLGERERRK
jgi:hypothetical protein